MTLCVPPVFQYFFAAAVQFSFLFPPLTNEHFLFALL